MGMVEGFSLLTGNFEMFCGQRFWFRYQEFSGDHEYINWRGTLADGLIWLFGDSKSPPLSSEQR
jgi:hypothetical protein